MVLRPKGTSHNKQTEAVDARRVQCGPGGASPCCGAHQDMARVSRCGRSFRREEQGRSQVRGRGTQPLVGRGGDGDGGILSHGLGVGDTWCVIQGVVARTARWV